MLAKTNSCAVIGLDGEIVEVEVDISHGLMALNVVGLPEKPVQEARERVRAAIRNSGYSFSNQRITVNLAPADLRKEGPAYDLPIAVGILRRPGKCRKRWSALCSSANYHLTGGSGTHKEFCRWSGWRGSAGFTACTYRSLTRARRHWWTA